MIALSLKIFMSQYSRIKRQASNVQRFIYLQNEFCLCWLDMPLNGLMTMDLGMKSPHLQFQPLSTRSLSVRTAPQAGHMSSASSAGPNFEYSLIRQ